MIKSIVTWWLLSFSLLFANNTPSFLVYGGQTGWIGQKVVHLIKESGFYVACGESRLENREALLQEISSLKPDYIINCAGVTGTPNVDWCETHKIETLRTNIIGTLNLIDVAYILNIPVTNLSTGCIYEYDETHPMYGDHPFTEEDDPNFEGSFYSKTKGYFEHIVKFYPNVLDLRLRMPISSDFYRKNFIIKLANYKKVINIPNSVSVLDDLLPCLIDLTLKGVKGTYNFVNPGTISHNEVLDLYKKYIDKDHTYENFTVEEQDNILAAKRSNNELSAEKLLKECPHIPHIKDSIHEVFKRMQTDKK